MKRLSIYLVGLISVNIHASAVNDVKVSQLMTNNEYGEYLYIQTYPVAAIDCESPSRWRYRLDIDTSIGKFMASKLMAAQASGAEVSLVGKGTCSSGNSEHLKQVIVK